MLLFPLCTLLVKVREDGDSGGGQEQLRAVSSRRSNGDFHHVLPAGKLKAPAVDEKMQPVVDFMTLGSIFTRMLSPGSD